MQQERKVIQIANDTLHIDPPRLPTPKHYIRIPKEIILASDLPEHRISAFIYFWYNHTWDESVHYSPIYMIQWCGYKPNWHRGTKENIYTKFTSCMQWYWENGYLLNFEKEKYITNTFQSSLLNMEKLCPSENYGIMYDFEIKKIMEYSSSYRPLTKSVLLLLLTYIRSYTWIRKSNPTRHSETSKRNKPEIFNSQFKQMANYIGVNERLISKATDVLVELGLIQVYRMPSYKDCTDTWRTDDIIYVCPYKFSIQNSCIVQDTENYNWESELKYGIDFLQNMNYVTKKFYQE